MGREKPLPYFSVNWDRIKNILKYASHEQIQMIFSRLRVELHL